MKFATLKHRRSLIVVSLAVALLGAALLVAFASSLYEVQDRGRGPGIVPYDSGLLYKVQVLDAFTLYAPEEARPEADKLSAIALVAATTTTLVALLLLGAAGGDARLRRFFAFTTAGLALLTFDELFALHEMIGHNLRFLADVPGVARPDDLIFVLYGPALLVFAWCFRDLLFAHRRPAQLFAIGTVVFAIAALGDLAGSIVDEPAEVVASACLLAGLGLLTAICLRQELELDRLAASRVAREPHRAVGREAHAATPVGARGSLPR
jgi:hypothetical protein